LRSGRFLLLDLLLARGEQFEEGGLAGIAQPTLVPLDDARITARPIGEARREIREQLLRRGGGHQESSGLPASMERIALAERDHFLGDGASRLRAQDGGVNAPVLDEVGHQITQHGAAMRRLLAEFGS